MEDGGERESFLTADYNADMVDHVRYRLERYGAGRRMDFDDSPPDRIAGAIAEEIGREVDNRDVETDGAARAAQRLALVLGRPRKRQREGPALGFVG